MKICFITSGKKESEAVSSKYQKKYGQTSFHEADVIVVFGGDGLILRALHKIIELNTIIPIYAMNMGNVGFLANPLDNRMDILAKIESATHTTFSPIKMNAKLADGSLVEEFGINEIYLFRNSPQALKMTVTIDKVQRLESYVGDGMIYSTPIGSTAYNFSCNGPILPIDSPLVALTPISPFRPKHLKSVILDHNSTVKLDILEHKKRPANIIADFIEHKEILEASLAVDFSKHLTLLFDGNRTLVEKIAQEQFS